MNEHQTNRHPDRRTAADATARPDLFRDTYWGRFTLARNPDITPAIIRNRNAFARDWKLRSRSRALLPRPTVLGGEDYDHCEQYRDEAGWFVLACSNYGDIPPPAIIGLRKVPPLYCEGATSYAGRFASLRELRARLEAVEGAPKFGAVRNLFSEPPTPSRSARERRGRLMA